MSSLTIVKMGTPSLQERSREVSDFKSAFLSEFISNLIETLHTHGGVGIAAPQVGVNQRIILVGFEHNPRYPNEKPVPLTILINPEYQPLSDERVDGWEGCLSIPGLRGKVPRYTKIHYTAQNLEGEKIESIAEGFHARIIQHECDHLDGVLFIERMVDLKSLGFEEIIMEKIRLETLAASQDSETVAQ